MDGTESSVGCVTTRARLVTVREVLSLGISFCFHVRDYRGKTTALYLRFGLSSSPLSPFHGPVGRAVGRPDHQLEPPRSSSPSPVCVGLELVCVALAPLALALLPVLAAKPDCACRGMQDAVGDPPLAVPAGAALTSGFTLLPPLALA